MKEVMRIETERLVLRPLRVRDGNAMHEVLTDFENSEYRLYDYKPPLEMDKIEMLIRYWVRSGKYFTLTVKDTGKIIGFICFEDNEIGFSIKTEYHRKGYGYEATKAFIDCIASKGRTRIVTAQAAIENVPSVSLLKKLGFVLKSTEYIRFRSEYPAVYSGNFELEI